MATKIPRPHRRGSRAAATPWAGGVRERILDAALALLAESGLHHLTQVQVATRAGVRQSHLTYYFPTRHDLLEAVTARGVDGMAAGLRDAVGGGRHGRRRVLERLAHAVAEIPHMRLFVAMIVEADGDAAVRAVMRGATRRMEAALADALGGPDLAAHARVVLAATWGIGLYAFLMRPQAEDDPRDGLVTWLAERPLGADRPPARRRRPSAG